MDELEKLQSTVTWIESEWGIVLAELTKGELEKLENTCKKLRNLSDEDLGKIEAHDVD